MSGARLRMALVAMSGVRVRDPELERLGLTLPGFVDRGRVIASLPSLGLATLAGMTPPDVEVSYHEVDALPDGDDVPREDVQVVCIAAFTARVEAAYEMARRYRSRGVTVVLGGLHVTARPREAALHADVVVLGEAEPVWPSVVRDLLAGTPRPMYDGRSLPFDLADAPLPRFTLFADRPYHRFTMQSQRGCPWDCEFCASSIRLRPGFRPKPAMRMRDELAAILDVAPRAFVELADDNTFASRAHGMRVCEELQRAGVRWFTETDLSFADDEDLIERAADAGCAQVLIGLESPRRAALDGVELQRDWKARQVERYAQAIDRIQSRGISVNGCFVLGLDGAGEEQFDDVLQFVRTSELDEVQVTVQTPFPGTPLYERLRSEGRLLAGGEWSRCTLFDVTFEPTGTSVDELRAGLLRLTRELYSEEATAQRRECARERFRACRRAQRRTSS